MASPVENERAFELHVRGLGRPEPIKPADRAWLTSLPLEDRMAARYALTDWVAYDVERSQAKEDRRREVVARYDRFCDYLRDTPGAADRFTREIERRYQPGDAVTHLFTERLGYLEDLIDWSRFGEEQDRLARLLQESPSLYDAVPRIIEHIVTRGVVDPEQYVGAQGENEDVHIRHAMLALLNDWGGVPKEAFREYTSLGLSRYGEMLHGATLPELETLMDIPLEDLHRMFGPISTAETQEEALQLLHDTLHGHLPVSLGRPPTAAEEWSPSWVGEEVALPGGLMLITAAKLTHLYEQSLSLPRFQEALVVNYGPSCGAAESFLAATVAGRIRMPRYEGAHVHRGHVDVYGSVESVRESLLLHASSTFKKRRNRRFVEEKGELFERRDAVRPIVGLHGTPGGLAHDYDLIWAFVPPGADMDSLGLGPEELRARLDFGGRMLLVGHDGGRATYEVFGRDGR